jgi:hypothetical protein
MPRGGKRAGAGRKAGGRNKKSREIADKAAAEGITPIEVMLHVMRSCFKQKNYKDAAAIAAQAAPYIHPRLAAVTHEGDEARPIHLVEKLVIIDGNADTNAARPS